MSAKPIIQTTGSIAGVGTQGEGRKDFGIGESCAFADLEVANGAASHAWFLSDRPPLSAAVLTDPLTATPALVMDVTGTYTVDVIVDNNYRAKILVAVALPNSGMRLPGLNEQSGDYNEGGNEDSYHPDFVAGMRALDAVATGGSADALSTTGAPVIVNAAVPPTMGQVLKATSPTNATWQADTGIANHALGGADHDPDTLINLNSKISDADLIDTNDPRLTDNRTDTTAIHDNVAGEINAIALKPNAVSADVILIEDSAAAFAKKRTTLSSMLSGDGVDTSAIHDTAGGEINAITTKASPLGSDIILIEDSADSFLKKKALISALPAPSDPAAIHGNISNEFNGIGPKAVPVGDDLLLLEDSEATFGKRRVTVADLIAGGGGTAIHDDVAGEINAIALKPNAVSADVILIEDSAAAFAKKRTTLSSMLSGDGVDTSAIHDTAGGEINAITTKASPLGSDIILIEDSADSFLKKKALISALPAPSDPAAIHGNISNEFNGIGPKAAPLDGADLLLLEDSAATFGKRRVTVADLRGPSPISVVVGTAATSVTLTGLDGDADSVYEITGRLLLALGVGNIVVRPNNVTTNLKSSQHKGSSVIAEATTWRLSSWTVAAATYHALHFKMILHAARTTNGVSTKRRYHFTGSRDAGDVMDYQAGAGVYDDATANLTSLVFLSNVAAGILAGSDITAKVIA